jgi:two-component system sensor histidine kinase TctE
VSPPAGRPDPTAHEPSRTFWRQALRGPRSLRRQLLLWLLLPQLVLWGAAAAVTYHLAARYANEATDAALSQATRALARQVKPLGNGLFIDLPRAAQDIIESDPSDRVYYMVSTPPGQFILGNYMLPPPPDAGRPPVLDKPRFYDGVMDDLPVRVSALYLDFGEADAPRQTMLVQIARGRASREALLRGILVDTALPLSVLIVLMSMIVWAGINAGLAPLARLRSQVEHREPSDLAPLRLDDAPLELRSLVGALNGLLEAVHGHVVSQQRFISDAAHQLRTPLAGLKSQTELALAATADPDLRARLTRVHQSATRGAHLVNQLLTLARAEPSAAAAQDGVALDLTRLVRELTAELVPRALQAGIDLGIDLGDEDEQGEPLPAPALWVSGNPLLLREALLNLVDNALRYAGRGAVVTVRLRALAPDPAQRGPGRVQVEVEDDGPGIGDADPERLFQRFVRGTHEGDGCGLGLPIVREIVERHHGEVHLERRQPHGLRVRVNLPRRGAPGS